METVVVVGNGMCGARLCERLVEGRTPSIRIVVFGAEPRPAYDRVHLAHVLADAEQDLALHDVGWYPAHGIELHLGDPVVRIDREQRCIRSASGMSIDYDRVVLATGSRPFVPDIPGTDLPDVFLFRTVEDLRAIRERAKTARRAVVIGGGLLGLEAAKVLADQGLATDVVEAAPRLMPRQLDEEGARVLRQKVEATGVRVHLGRAPLAITVGEALDVRLPDSRSLPADLVVIAAGIRPATALAISAGLAMARNGGVEVDDHLESSDPRILAIGECASHRGTVYGLVPPAYRMAEVVAQRLLGREAVFTGGDTSAKLKLLGVAVACLGRTDPEATCLTYRAPGCYRRLFLSRGHLAGAIAVGDWGDIDDVVQLIESRRSPSLWARRRFPRAGRIRRGRAADPLVCVCLRVPRSTLASAGCASVDELSRCTGAGTLCGSCKPQLAALCGVAAAPPRRSPGLLAGALAALAALLLWFFAAPAGDRLYAWTAAHHTFWSQLTGYGALGLSLLGLSLSLRKRWRRFHLGTYDRFRAVHVIVNGLAVLAIAAHTGLRFGDNLNRVLLTAFLATGLTGTIAGALASFGGSSRRLYWLHLVVAWPLLGLLVAHMFHAYYY